MARLMASEIRVTSMGVRASPEPRMMLPAMKVTTMLMPPREKARRKLDPCATTSGCAPSMAIAWGAKSTPSALMMRPSSSPKTSDCLAARLAASWFSAPTAWATRTVVPMLTAKKQAIATWIRLLAAPTPAIADEPSWPIIITSSRP